MKREREREREREIGLYLPTILFVLMRRLLVLAANL